MTSTTLASVRVHQMRLPFDAVHAVEADRWPFGDSVIVTVTDGEGTTGYGEGKPRPKITGETPALTADYLTDVVWPSLQGVALDAPDRIASWTDLPAVADLVPSFNVPGVRAWNATLCAIETAIVDLLLRQRGQRLADILPERRAELPPCAAVRVWEPHLIEERAGRMYGEGARNFRLKVTADFENQLAAFFGAVGDDVELHIDGNGNFTVDTLPHFVERSVGRYDIAAVEDPVTGDDPETLAAISAALGPKLMLDNWIVTADDVDRVIDTCGPCVAYLKVSRCGGIGPTARMAERFADAGFRLGLGTHVGETGLINMVARRISHWLPDLAFASPSFAGPSRLATDVGAWSAPDEGGLGFTVDDGVLDKYADHVTELS